MNGFDHDALIPLCVFIENDMINDFYPKIEKSHQRNYKLKWIYTDIPPITYFY